MANRNNEDRTGERRAAGANAPPQAISPMIPSSETTGPAGKPLDFTCPTEFVDIPSKGRFYPKDHPLHNKDSLEIRFMTAKDEDILTSKSLLKKGVAIDRFLQNIIVDKSIELSSLIVGDKNAIVVASRITGYGADYGTKVTCPACGASQDYSFDLELGKVSEGGTEGLKDNPEMAAAVDSTDNNTWVIDCPKSKAIVEMKLLTGVDEKHMLKSQAMKKKNKLPEALLTDQLRQTIVSVNGDSSKLNINRFIDVMPALDSRYVRSIYEKLMPNVDLTQEFECHSCGFEQEMEVPFTTDFFWPKR